MHSRLLTGLVLAAVVTAACGPRPTPPPAGTPGASSAIAVTVAPARQATISQSYTATGDVKAASEISVVPKQAGRIEKMPVDVGTAVRAGDVLAQLEHTSLDLNLANAQAQLAGSQAKLATIKAGPRDENVKQAELNLSSAQAKLQAMLNGPRSAAVTQATSSVDSAKQKLAAVKAGGKAEVIRQAQASLTSAQSRLQALKNGLKPEDIASSELAVSQAKNALLSAQISRDGACANPGFQCNAANAAVNAAQTGVDLATSNLKSRVAAPTATDLQQAQAAVDQAQAALEAAQKPYTEQDVKQAEAAVTAAVAGLALTNQPYTAEDIQQARNAVETSNQLLLLAKKPFTDQDLQSAEAAVAQAQVSVDQAQQNVKDATVTAPIDGVVTGKLLDVGALASTAAPLVTIASTALKVSIPVEETRVTDLKVGQSASISGAVLGTSVIAGRVTNVAPSGDAKARKFIAEIAPDRVDTLLPGMFVKVAVGVQEHQNVVAVPSTALTTRGDKTFVFVVQDNVAHQTPVETGLSNATLTEVGASVSSGANVVVQGLEGLNDGDHVNVLATQPAS